jgi:branched-chain amino acid transport system substrate-binding protein
MNSVFKGRRSLIQGAGLVAMAASSPLLVRRALAAEPIKIGIPCALTGSLAVVAEQTKRTATLFAKQMNAAGGINGRPIELIIEDTGGNPATCVRKVQQMVERDGCRIFTGITFSSETLAVMPRLAEWDSIYVACGNGDASMTADAFVPNFFRGNPSGPTEARLLSLYIKDSGLKKFYAIGMDYSWGHSTVAAFEQEMKRNNIEFVGKVFAPTGTRDFSSYITKIRQSGADGLMMVQSGDDANAFMTQAAQYRLGDKVKMFTTLIELSTIKAVGEASKGVIGTMRYMSTYDDPVNKTFVDMFTKEIKETPDWNDGEQWKALQFIATAIKKANTTKSTDLIKALDGMELDTVKGKASFRACDHQSMEDGFVVQVDKVGNALLPVLVKKYPAEQITPACLKKTFDS